MENTIRAIYSRWNDNDLEGVIAAFKELGPKGFTIEYVGNSPLDGEQAVRDMWKDFGGTCTTDIVELLINGDEGAAHVANNLQAEGGVTTLPSIETYHVSAGKLAVRYFHRAP